MNRVLANVLAGVLLFTGPFGAVASDGAQAQNIVQTATEKMLGLLRTEEVKNDPSLLAQKVDEIIVPNIDFYAMTRLALGKSWGDANPEQHQLLIGEFQQLLIGTYTKTLRQYTDEKINFLPYEASAKPNRAIVRSEFVPSGGASIPVDYKLRHKDQTWKIYDIKVDGISLVTNYRSSFAAQVQQGGIDNLIASLKEKNASGEDQQ